MSTSRQRGRWLLYGAYGYTGQLVARRAHAAGVRPVLAGRDERRLAALATELDCEHRSVGLDDHDALVAALDGVELVAHCAGPFSHTSEPMVQACLEAGVHYLDITGEVAVLDAVLARDADARAAGVVLLPGAGFDVVPSDCLAAIAAEQLAGPVQSVELAFLARGGPSAGTARTGIEGLGEPPLRRRDGRLVPVRGDERRRCVEFVTGSVMSTAISWGDLATAHRSTGARDVIVHVAMPRVAYAAMRALDAMLVIPGARALAPPLLDRAARRLAGPGEDALRDAGCELWVRVCGADGSSVERRMTTPNGYALTADSVLRVVQAIIAGDVQPGAHTPSTALGARFALTLDGVELHGFLRPEGMTP